MMVMMMMMMMVIMVMALMTMMMMTMLVMIMIHRKFTMHCNLVPTLFESIKKATLYDKRLYDYTIMRPAMKKLHGQVKAIVSAL